MSGLTFPNVLSPSLVNALSSPVNHRYNSDPWAVILLSAAPWAIFLPLMFASAQLVRDMVHEKQEKIKAAMMMMGVRRTHHWLAWFIRGIGSIGLSLVVSHFPHHCLYLSPTSP